MRFDRIEVDGRGHVGSAHFAEIARRLFEIFEVAIAPCRPVVGWVGESDPMEAIRSPLSRLERRAEQARVNGRAEHRRVTDLRPMKQLARPENGRNHEREHDEQTSPALAP